LAIARHCYHVAALDYKKLNVVEDVSAGLVAIFTARNTSILQIHRDIPVTINTAAFQPMLFDLPG
jgi:hypothetical protein